MVIRNEKKKGIPIEFGNALALDGVNYTLWV